MLRTTSGEGWNPTRDQSEVIMVKAILLGVSLFGTVAAMACDVRVRMYQIDDGERINKGRGCIEISELDVDSRGRTFREIRVTDYRPPAYEANVNTHTARNGKTVSLLTWGIFDLVKLKALSDNEGELKFRGGERRRITINDSGVPLDAEDRDLCIRVSGGKLTTQPLRECAGLE